MSNCRKCSKLMSEYADRNCEGFCTNCFHQTRPYEPPKELLPWEESVEDEVDVVDEDWLAGVSCNPDAPEECESCQ